MPSTTQTFGITGISSSSLLVKSMEHTKSAQKTELQGPTGETVAVGYYGFKEELSISAVGDLTALQTVGATLALTGAPTGTWKIDSISTSRSLEGFAEIQISASNS
jgi:hypothetical protein